MKEMIIDFGINPVEGPPVIKNNEPVEIVGRYKYLESVVDNKGW